MPNPTPRDKNRQDPSILPVSFIKKILMDKENFKRLSDHEKLRILFNAGKFGDSIQKGNTLFALYSMRTSYIEFQYNTSTFCMTSKRAFEKDQGLNKNLNWKTAV